MTGFLCALPLIARLARLRRARRCWRWATSRASTSTSRRSTAATLIEVAAAPGRPGDRRARSWRRQERADAEIALAEAEAARDQAEAELANLREGSRPEEIAVTEASLEAARVRLREAERQADRQTALAERGVVPQADLDTALADRDTARTEVAAARGGAGRAAPARPGPGGRRRREPPRAAPRPRCATPAGGWSSATSSHRPTGTITDVFRRAGEIAGPTAPVLSLLPDGAYKLVVFVGETAVAGIAPGRPFWSCAATAARPG